MQYAAYIGERFTVEADGSGAIDGVIVGFGVAVFAGYDLDAVGTENVQLARLTAKRRDFQIGIAGDQQEAIPGLEQFGFR